MEDEISLLQAGAGVLPPIAYQLAEQAARGELQAALSLARLAAECPSLPLRRGLCRKIREIAHPESARVALLYLLSQLARHPDLSMPLVMDLLEGPQWVASAPDSVSPSEAAAASVPAPQSNAPAPSTSLPSPPMESIPWAEDIKSLRALFLGSSPSERRHILQRCLATGQLSMACQLPLDGDEWQQLWPHLALELREQVLLSLPVSLACKALELLQESPEWRVLARAVPVDQAFLGWATPAPSQIPVPRATELSNPRFSWEASREHPAGAPYYDGVDGALEHEGWSIRAQGQRVEVCRPVGCPLWKIDLGDSSPDDLGELARHDRFFEDLHLGKSHQLSSLALTTQAQKLAVATSGGGLRLYDLERGHLLHEVYAEGPPAPEALPIRIRFSEEGRWLAGVRLGHFFVWGEAGERTLDSLPGELRGLFFLGSQLWAMVRDGSVYRLDPERGRVTQELKPGQSIHSSFSLQGGILPALSPDRRWLARYDAEQIQFYQLSDEGLLPMSQVPAPRPFRIYFADGGQALVLRLPDSKKPGARSAPTDRVWRAGHLCLSEITELELACYRSQSCSHPHPVWDFLVALAEATIVRRPGDDPPTLA